jgi:hypothetical protein
MIWPFKRRSHSADQYFAGKFRESMGREAHATVCTAFALRHQYPDLSGPELVRLVYWGGSGAAQVQS